MVSDVGVCDLRSVTATLDRLVSDMVLMPTTFMSVVVTFPVATPEKLPSASS